MGIRVEKLEDIFPMADFIADAMGPIVEVVVHDVSDLEVSVVYIRNGKLSGRKVGDGATDRALKLIREGRYSRAYYVSNYSGLSLAGRQFRCSTCFVENMSGELVGLLCVNFDVSGLETAADILARLLAPGREKEASRPVDAASIEAQGDSSSSDLAPCGSDHASGDHATEMLVGSPEETVRKICRLVLSKYPVEPSRLLRAERVAALACINEEGAFYMKGAVSIVAEEMGISVPTVYKYLQEIRPEAR